MPRFESSYEGLAKGLQTGHQMAITSEMTELARNRDTREQEQLGMAKERQAVDIETQKQQQRATQYKLEEAEREKQFGMAKSPMDFGPKEAEKIKKMVGTGGIGKEHFEVLRDPESGKETYMVSNYAKALYVKMMSSHNEMSKSISEAKVLDANNAYMSAKTEYEEAKSAGKNEKELGRLKEAMDSALKIKQGVDGYDQRMQEEAEKERIKKTAEANAMGFTGPDAVRKLEDYRNKNAERLQQLRLNAEAAMRKASDEAAMERTKYMYEAKERMLKSTLSSKEYVANQKKTAGFSIFGSEQDKLSPALSTNSDLRRLHEDVHAAIGNPKKQEKLVTDYIKEAHMDKVYSRTGDVTQVAELVSQAYGISDPIESRNQAQLIMNIMVGVPKPEKKEEPKKEAVTSGSSVWADPKTIKSQGVGDYLDYGFPK